MRYLTIFLLTLILSLYASPEIQFIPLESPSLIQLKLQVAMALSHTTLVKRQSTEIIVGNNGRTLFSVRFKNV
jgi:hypothetical protein